MQQRNAARKLELAARRENQRSRVATYEYNSPEGVLSRKKAPMGRSVSLMKMSNRLAGMRYILKHSPNRIKDEPGLVAAIRTGQATRQMIYGYHPTKGGKRHA